MPSHIYSRAHIYIVGRIYIVGHRLMTLVWVCGCVWGGGCAGLWVCGSVGLSSQGRRLQGDPGTLGLGFNSRDGLQLPKL